MDAINTELLSVYSTIGEVWEVLNSVEKGDLDQKLLRRRASEAAKDLLAARGRLGELRLEIREITPN
jgi:hypothetical protein